MIRQTEQWKTLVDLHCSPVMSESDRVRNSLPSHLAFSGKCLESLRFYFADFSAATSYQMMRKKKGFRDLKMWQDARTLANTAYELTGKIPFQKDFPFGDQLRKSVISCMSNIAEGFDSDSERMFLRYLRIAKGSIGEIQSLLVLAKDRDYISDMEFKSCMTLADCVARQIRGLMKYLHRKLKTQV